MEWTTLEFKADWNGKSKEFLTIQIFLGKNFSADYYTKKMWKIPSGSNDFFGYRIAGRRHQKFSWVSWYLENILTLSDIWYLRNRSFTWGYLWRVWWAMSLLLDLWILKMKFPLEKIINKINIFHTHSDWRLSIN